MHLPAHARTPWRHALRTATITWPPSGDGTSRHAACQIADLPKPPTHGPGEVPLLAVSSTTSSLWLLDVARGHPGAPLGPSARQAWASAATALTRSVPVLWSPTDHLSRDLPTAHRVALEPLPGLAAADEQMLDGDSFGLSFVLAMASWSFAAASPRDLLASATVDAAGRTGAVDGLADKLRAVAKYVHGPVRLLVSSRQRDGLDDTSHLGVTVIRVDSAAQAVQIAFPDLDRRLAAAGSDSRVRSQRVQSLFRVALGPRNANIDWTPIARAAHLALETWPGLTADERTRLSLSWAFARRHQSFRDAIDVPDGAWIESHPPPVRQHLVAQLTQHAADGAVEDRHAVEALASSCVETISESFPAQLRLHGALGRLWAVTGRHQQAHGLQRDLVYAWMKRFNYEELSHPLCEWLRLAGALGHSESYDEAIRVWRSPLVRGAVADSPSAPYVELAIGRGAWALGRPAGRERLESLQDDATAPAHVSAIATRLAGYEAHPIARPRPEIVALLEATGASPDLVQALYPY